VPRLEKLTAYEVGAKSVLLDRRLRLNLALFVNRYGDIQTTLMQCPHDPGPPCALPLNVGNADIKGAELELEAHPSENWSIDGSQPVGIPVGADFALAAPPREWSIQVENKF